MKGHLLTERISGPCSQPPHHIAHPAHVVGVTIHCAEHCPECNYQHPERELKPVIGEQENLFG
jgi:hypothetical protein